MLGMNNEDGKPLDGIAHLKQSIRDILTTPIGSRVMRREYGSRLFELVDRPMNPSTVIEYYTATAIALYKWEPRFRLSRVQIVSANENGQIVLLLSGIYVPKKQPIEIEMLL